MTLFHFSLGAKDGMPVMAMLSMESVNNVALIPSRNCDTHFLHVEASVSCCLREQHQIIVDQVDAFESIDYI
eukprot:scaffold8948_cov59-Attheya_sp.AAC.1